MECGAFIDSTFQTCRSCLCKTKFYFDLLLNEKLLAMLESVAAIKINLTEDISTMVCLKCRLNLTLAYKIQQNMKNTETILHDQLQIEKDEEVLSLVSKSDSNEELEDPINTIEIIEIEEKVQCPLCSELFNNKEEMQHHKYNHERKKCPICEMDIQAFAYDYHVKSHETIPESVAFNPSKVKTSLKCEFCEKCFSKAEQRDKHIMLVHENLTCPVCNKNCSSKAKLRAHKDTHLRKICPVCNKSVAKTFFHKHVTSHEEGSYICDLCGLVYKNKNNLRQHIYYSHNARRYTCEYCDMKFTRNNHKTYHIKKEHLNIKDFVCETCGKKFITNVQLTEHNNKTHLKTKIFQCEFCQKKCYSKFSLKTHERQHTNETPYKCEECGEGFKQKVSLRMHKKSKHGIAGIISFTCKVCDKGFDSKAGLDTHSRKHE